MSRAEFEGLAREIARTQDLPVEGFLALVRVESAWNPRAVSPAGAQGLTQLMPATAVELGVTDPFDPRQNLEAGARYLRRCLAWVTAVDPRIAADPAEQWAAALTAYNWGIGNFRRAYERAGDAWVCELPAETEDYINILAPLFSGRETTVTVCGDAPTMARRFPWLLLLAFVAIARARR